jgi:hypothetical protein
MYAHMTVPVQEEGDRATARGVAGGGRGSTYAVPEGAALLFQQALAIVAAQGGSMGGQNVGARAMVRRRSHIGFANPGVFADLDMTLLVKEEPVHVAAHHRGRLRLPVPPSPTISQRRTYARCALT